MSKITVVTYVHEAHKPWIPFWAEQISKQTLGDFDVLFIAHNWGTHSLVQEWTNYNEFSDMLKDSPIWTQGAKPDVRFESYWSAPVIGEVIDEGCRMIETEYFAHWDVDDPMHPERLRLQHEFLVANPDIDFLNARAIGFHGEVPEWPDDLLHRDKTERPLIQELTDPQLQTHDQIKRMISRGFNCLAHGLMVYRPESIMKLGGFSRSDVKLDGKSPDFETWKKALMAGYQFHRLPELLMMWRLDSSSIRS